MSKKSEKKKDAGLSAPEPTFPKFRFVGEGEDDPKEISHFGVVFELDGDPVEVESQLILGKIIGNSHFELIDD